MLGQPLIFKCVYFVFAIVTAVLGNDAAVWVSGRGAGQPFTVHGVINYLTQYGILYPFLWAVCVYNATFGLYQ